MGSPSDLKKSKKDSLEVTESAVWGDRKLMKIQVEEPGQTTEAMTLRARQPAEAQG